MSTFLQQAVRRCARRWPATVHAVLAAAHTTVLTTPALTIAAIITGHTALAVAGGFASILCYATGYHTAALRYTQRLHAAVAAARRDKLTGLPTRAVADEALDTATRDAANLTVALADVDGLHAINTNLGHAAGDQYLLTVAQRLARAVPDGGRLVRYGGDEFTLLVPGTSPDDLATAIGAAMAGPAVIAGYRIQPRVSVGIAASAGGDARHALACADAAMYTAKAAGGNHIRSYQPDRDGQPADDGTRPLLRLRDLTPAGHDGVAWLPSRRDDLLPLLFSLDEARAVYRALCLVRDRWVQPAAGAEAPAATVTSDMPSHSGPAAASGEAAAEQSVYARLTDRITPIIEAGERLAADRRPPDARVGVASTVLVGISAEFTALDIEGLVVTAAEAVYGNADELSLRQYELASRAYDLLHADDDTDDEQSAAAGQELPR